MTGRAAFRKFKAVPHNGTKAIAKNFLYTAKGRDLSKSRPLADIDIQAGIQMARLFDKPPLPVWHNMNVAGKSL